MNDQSRLFERELSSKLIFDGKVVHLYVDEVELPDGAIATREYVKHIGAVAVLLFTATLQAYAAAYAFSMLVIKGIVLIKRA